MAVGFNPSSSRRIAYQPRGPVGAAAPAAARYPHLLGDRPGTGAGQSVLASLQAQLLALRQQLLGLISGTPRTDGVSAGALSLEQLRQGRFAGCLFGSSTQGKLETAERMAAKLGRPLDVNHSYYRWEDKLPSAEDRADVAAGRLPWISFNAASKTGRTIRWAEIASGQHDARLREVARGIKSLGKPVFFTFNHEPENDQVRGTPEEYKAAWKRVSEILRAEGATNAVKVYVTMGWKPELSEAHYPGDAVDWIAGDPYNWAFSKQQPGAGWRSFEQAVSKFYGWARTKGKPLMIGETGCLEDPAQPGRKAQWLREMGESLKRMPEIKGLCYFNNRHDDGAGQNDWHVDTPQALAAFRQVAQDPYLTRH